MTNSDQEHQLLTEAIATLLPIARSTGVRDIDQIIAEIRLAMQKLESAVSSDIGGHSVDRLNWRLGRSKVNVSAFRAPGPITPSTF